MSQGVLMDYKLTFNLQSINIQNKMSSFTPLFNHHLSQFQTGFCPWVKLETRDPTLFVLLPINNFYVPHQRADYLVFQQKNTHLTGQCIQVQGLHEPQKQNQRLQIEQKRTGERVQCIGRNDYSNILKAFVHLIKTNTALKKKIKCIISARQLVLTFERFLMRIKHKFPKGKTYISPKEILLFLNCCSQSSDYSQKAIGLLFKITLKHFLSIQYGVCLISNFKGKTQSRNDLIMKSRQLSKLIFQEGLCFGIN